MQTWEISGADSSSGASKTISLAAASQQDALALANSRGIFVNAIRAIDGRQHHFTRKIYAILIIGIVILALLGICSFIVGRSLGERQVKSPVAAGAAPSPQAKPDLVNQEPKQPSGAELFEQGLSYRNQRKNESAYSAFRDAADLGNIDAMNAVGVCYSDGVGTDKDTASAKRWFEKASSGGSAEAAFYLGNLYGKGDGVPKSEEKAFELFLKSARAGYTKAMNNVGTCYEHGIGTARNTQAALEWFRRGADGNDPTAMYNLGVMYGNGDGVAVDEAEGTKWLRLAARDGNPEAVDLLARLGDDETPMAKPIGRPNDLTQLFDSDPAASFRQFSKHFVSTVNSAEPAKDYQVKIAKGYSIDVKKTGSLVSPFVGTVEGGLNQYRGGKMVSDVSTIGNDKVRFPVEVRCTFVAREGKWQLQDVKINPWGSGWTSALSSDVTKDMRAFWQDAYHATPNP